MKKCPHCGSTLFKTVIKRPGIVDFAGDEPVIKQEGKKTGFEVWECANKDCNAKLTNDDLVGESVCKVCGKPVDEKYMIDGVCLECKAKQEIPGYENMSAMDRLKYVFDLKQNMESKNVAAKANAKEEKGQAASTDKTAKTTEDTKQENSDNTDNKTTTRRRGHNAHKPTEENKEAAATDNKKEESTSVPDPAPTPDPVNQANNMSTPPNIEDIEVPF